MWNVEKVRALVADQNHAATFFCGGSRNSDRFIDLLDGVFVLEIDLDTLNRRLAARPEDEWGGTASEVESFARLHHATKEGLPTNAIIIDATAPLSSVVDTILEHANEVSPEEPRDSGARFWPKAYTGKDQRRLPKALNRFSAA